MGGHLQRMVLCAACLAGGACAVTGRGGPAATAGPAPTVAGIWEGVFRSTLADGAAGGDTRIERQAWRLVQDGAEVSGYYVLELTMISGDGRPYLCSHEPRFSTLLRFDVRGRVVGSNVELEEVGDVQAKGSCRPTTRTPLHYQAAVRGNVLTLSDGERALPLHRRRASEARAVGTLLAFEESERPSDTPPPPIDALARPPESTEPPTNIEGLWTWEHRGPLPTGDEKVEREEWHLVQEGSSITGYYDRAVHQISTDGHAYRCSAAIDFRFTTRYQITGEVSGNRVVLFERGFEIIEGSPCDDGRRRLDAYRGQAESGEIRLLWGVGTQVLRRARPNVPTQRF